MSNAPQWLQRSLVPGPLGLLIILCCTASAALLKEGRFGEPSLGLWVALTLGTGLLEAAVARFSTGTQRWTMSVTEVVLVVALLLGPGTWVALAGAAGQLLAQMVRRKRNPTKVAFNVAMYMAAFGLAGETAVVLGGGVVGAVLGVLVFWFTNFLLVAAAVVLTTAAGWRTLLGRSLPLSLFHMTVNVSVGLSAAAMVREQPLAVAGLMVPLVAILASYEAITRRVDETGLLDTMLSNQDRVTSRPTEEYAQIILSTAAQIFDTREVELLVLRNSDEPLKVTLDPETGSARVRLATAADLDQPWVLRSLAAPADVAVEQALRRSWATVRIGDADRPLAVLGAHKPAGSDRGISRRDRRLAAMLADRSARWLESPDPEVDGDLARGTHRDPVAAAQAALRSAAYRLVENSDRIDAYGTRDVVTELHRVERAVTGLLGAAGAGTGTGRVESPVPGEAAPGYPLPASAPVAPELIALAAARSDDWVVLPSAPEMSPRP